MRHYLANVTVDDLEFIDKFNGRNLKTRWVERYSNKVNNINIYVNKHGWFTYNDKETHDKPDYKDYIEVDNIEDLIRLDTSPEFYENYLRSVTKLGELL